MEDDYLEVGRKFSNENRNNKRVREKKRNGIGIKKEFQASLTKVCWGTNIFSQ